jgi:hypothetical protein
MQEVETYSAIIYVGFRVGRTSNPTHGMNTIADARRIVHEYVAVGLCVTMTPTEFVYTGGGEPGVAVGLINYPRFPSSHQAIYDHAIALGEKLRVGLNQFRVSVVFPDKTVMLGMDDA